MSRLARSLAARSCAVGRGERALRGVIAVFLGAFALSNLDNPWCAIPAGICSTFLAIGAITGWCPTDLLSRSADATEPNLLGYPEARRELLG
ncbi:YgaP family membrane protein [Agromyces sp. M3QZ16-3]|uniref:YgaP family membrane protein n=1 Tax=Agromyces sp. M3QZ16-3 TaxID=3447585 RepID=UPI003F68E3F2